MTFDEKIKIVSKFLEVFELASDERKHQLAGIIMGYSMASQSKASKES